MMKSIDHIVYCCLNLEETMRDLFQQYGIESIYGGKHVEQGTHNALVNIGNNCYLEILALDPENTQDFDARWMGVDVIEQPRVTRWALKSDDIQRDVISLKNKNPLLGNIKTGMRRKEDGSILKWQLSMPLAQPKIEALPFLIDWQGSVHPTAGIEQSTSLHRLLIRHPDPDYLKVVFEKLNANVEIEQSDEIEIIVELMTPKGKVLLK